MSDSRWVEVDLDTDLVPAPAEYAALLPPDYDPSGEPYRLLVMLHGGSGNRGHLRGQQPALETVWSEGSLESVVCVMPTAQRGQYMDFHDRSERWESFVMGPFLNDVRERFHVRADREGTLITGTSMGGLGALKFAFKHPDVFGAVAAMEPGIEPAYTWVETRPHNTFFRRDPLFERIYGAPRDEPLWQGNNPASLVRDRADQIRGSGLGIYIECGDADALYLHEGTEFLHRALWERDISHEYRLVRGANHVGSSLGPRTLDALRFLGRWIDELTPKPEPSFSEEELEWIHWTLEGAKGEPRGREPALDSDAMLQVFEAGLVEDRAKAHAEDPKGDLGWGRVRS